MRSLIISEITRLAEANGGRAPGVGIFARETGITEAKWRGVYWARWSDAVSEAGYSTNALQARFDSGEVLRKVAELARHLGAVPTVAEMKLRRRDDATFPNPKTVASHFPGQAALIEALRAYAVSHPTHSDLIHILPAAAEHPLPKARPAEEGYVYLLASGGFYKIGRSDNLERRIKEISIALPEKTELIHAIRTDDPVGIEAYWHKRFSDRRQNGEWFKLSHDEVKAFRRRTFQ